MFAVKNQCTTFAAWKEPDVITRGSTLVGWIDLGCLQPLKNNAKTMVIYKADHVRFRKV